MKKLLIVVCFFTVLQIDAQIANLNMNGVPVRSTPYSNIDGSPYLFEEWSKADISFKNGDVKEKISLKMNLYDNEIEVITDAGNRIYLDKKYVSSFKINRPEANIDRSKGDLQVLTFKNGFSGIKGIDENAFVNVLAEGDSYTLIRKYKTGLVEPPNNSYSPTAGKMFVAEQGIFIKNSKGEISSSKAKTNSIIKSLDDSDKALGKNIAKEEKLDLSREDHLVRFFNDLNKAKK